MQPQVRALFDQAITRIEALETELRRLKSGASTLSGSVDGHFNALSGTLSSAIQTVTGGGLTSVEHDGTLSGSGTSAVPLSASPLSGTIDAKFIAYNLAVAASISNLSGTVDGHFNALSGTIDGHFNAAASTRAGFFGSGFDGALNFDGTSVVTLGDGTTLTPSSNTYSLTRDIFATNMTVGASAIIKTQRYRVFCSGTLTLTGAIRQDGANGTNGGNGSGGSAGASSTTTFGATGILATGGQGGTGTTSSGGAGTFLSSANRPLGAGTTTVNPGANGGRSVGGGGGSVGATAGGSIPGTAGFGAAVGALDSLWEAISGRSSGTQINPGAGGGGGAGSAAPLSCTGGGGGSPGGYVVVVARLITGAGTISATGGNGGSATFNNGGAGASGGGGGGGGIIVVATTSDVAALTPTITVAGGTGGTGIGTSGTSGGNGGAGFIYLFQV